MEELLDIVQRLEDWQLEVFCNTLVETDQVGVVEIIKQNIQRQQQQQQQQHGENTLLWSSYAGIILWSWFI